MRRLKFLTPSLFVTLFLLALAVSVVMLLPFSAASATTFDLNAEWSDAANPNGVWTYREGANALPHIDNWESLGQPGWAESETGNNRIPFWFKSVATATFDFDHDWQTGDVVVHTTDDTSGVGNGDANVIWTSPGTGNAIISGGVWMGRDIGRSNHWALFKNNVLLTEGDISSGDAFDRSSPFAFSAGSGGASAVQNIPVAPGDVLKLSLTKTSLYGDFVGVNLTVALVDHFLCYKAKTTPGTPKFAPQTVSLADQFESGNAQVKKPVSLCNPADKNGEGINDPDTHLKGYQIIPATPHVPKTNIKVVNQFGTIFVDTIKPDRLLVPTAKSLTGPVDPLDPVNIDHFQCYKVKVTKGTPKFPKGIQASVVDQFNQPKVYGIKKPTRLCNPVDKNGEGIKDETAHLMCYQAKPAKGQPKHVKVVGIHTANQFGQEQLDTVKEDELCVPSVKILPGP